MTEQKTSSAAGTAATLRWFRVIVLVAVLGWLGITVYQNATQPDSKHPFKLGLDLAGGSHLIYEADTSKVDPAEVPQLMSVLREVIERRVNIFGVSEPLVQVESSSFVSGTSRERLIVELPGVTDVAAAVAEIGKTPLLEFKLYSTEKAAEQATLANLQATLLATSSASGTATSTSTNSVSADSIPELPFVDTGLTGRYLQAASLEFGSGQAGQLANEPLVSVRFSEEGTQLFADITRAHVGEQLGIFLDGELLSAPVINEVIVGGTAIISGDFTHEEARSLAQNLSFGALPLPIALESTQTIDATLGADLLEKGLDAAVLGLCVIIVFLVAWYRVPGVVATVALLAYVTIMLALFQYIPVTLTAAGLAGFILSLGMAVDANVLVFERMKEEYRAGAGSRAAVTTGFARAWSAIRDGNVTSLLSAIVLFWFGTSLVKGFALVFGLGVIASMLTAVLITRTLLLVLPDVPRSQSGLFARLFGSGIQK